MIFKFAVIANPATRLSRLQKTATPLQPSRTKAISFQEEPRKLV
jgi:hypothetical protein